MQQRIDELQCDIQLQVFDILFLNDATFTEKPLKERYQTLQAIVQQSPLVKLAQSSTISNVDPNKREKLISMFNQSLTGNCEGLMIKDMASTYHCKRSDSWAKLKKDYIAELGDSFDLVPIGGIFGKGLRKGTFGSFLMAAYNDKTQQFETFCKVGTGFSKELAETLTDSLLQVAIPEKLPEYHVSKRAASEMSAWFKPSMVMEIKGADITESPVHSCGTPDNKKGVGLRFPKLVRVRDDKTWKEATTVSQILLMKQEQYKKQHSS